MGNKISFIVYFTLLSQVTVELICFFFLFPQEAFNDANTNGSRKATLKIQIYLSLRDCSIVTE